MKLDPKGVEKAAQNLMVHMGCEPIEDDWRACVAKHCSCRKAAEAALTAYFDHLKEAGLLERLGEVVDDPSKFSVGPLWTLADDDCPSNAFILRTDKE